MPAIIPIIWGFIPAKVKLGLIIAVILAVVGLGTWGYIKWEGHRITELQNQLLRSNMEITVLQTEKRQKEEDLATIQALNIELDNTKNQNQLQLAALQKRLKALQIGKQIILAPSDTEILVNRMSDERNRCLEIAAGSPVTQEELNVPKENRSLICPQLFHYKD